MALVEAEELRKFYIYGNSEAEEIFKVIKRRSQNSLRSLIILKRNVFEKINFQHELCEFLICKINIIASLSGFLPSRKQDSFYSASYKKWKMRLFAERNKELKKVIWISVLRYSFMIFFWWK